MGTAAGRRHPDSEPRPERIITLTSDFGLAGPYAGAMKGVILAINPRAHIVDLDHGVPPHNVRHGALVLDAATPFFPPKTIHVAVVDPGVGTARRIVYARLGTQDYIAPDNGLLSRLAVRTPPSKIVALTRSQYWRPHVSATFHGRDIMAPVAARLSLGLEPDLLGPRQKELVPLPWPEARVVAHRIEGEVVSTDSFGNLITNITAEMLRAAPADETVVIHCDEHETVGIFRTYGEQPPQTLIALIGSAGLLELAIVGDSAAAMLGVREGTKVVVRW